MLDYLQLLTNAESLEELWAAHCAKMEEYGFDRLIYGFTNYRTPTSLGDPDDFVVLSSHPPEYTDEFLGKGLYFHAPMLHWALNNEGVCSWSIMQEMLESGSLTPAEKKVVDFNRKMGVTAGYTISFKSACARSKGAIALTAQAGMTQDDVEELWAKHGESIHVINSVAHLKILTLPSKAPNRTLTKRQIEALQWVGDGKTVQDTAILMGLTPTTVDKHLRLARQTLSVETTAQAVLKASFRNQMFIVEA